METVLKMIRTERERQNKKWGKQHHNNSTWLLILMEEIGEASQCALQMAFGSIEHFQVHKEDLIKELVQCAAVVVAWIEAALEDDFGSSLPQGHNNYEAWKGIYDAE